MINEKNVAMSATESVYGNPLALAHDPFVVDGLAEDSIIVDPSIVAFFPTKIVVHACSFIIYHILPDTLKVYTLIFPNATTIN